MKCDSIGRAGAAAAHKGTRITIIFSRAMRSFPARAVPTQVLAAMIISTRLRVEVKGG